MMQRDPRILNLASFFLDLCNIPRKLWHKRLYMASPYKEADNPSADTNFFLCPQAQSFVYGT
jgi:hypothetical protein